MGRKLRTAWIVAILVVTLIPGIANADTEEPESIDFVNIGYPTSEANHNLYGWGPIEPAHSGGTWGGAGEDGNCRVISSGHEDETGMNNLLDWARFTMDFGDSSDPKYLLIRHLDGYAIDSFYVYIDALGEPGDETEVLYWPDEQSQGEVWRTAQIPLSLTGVHTVYLLSDQPHWSGWESYGQVAFTWASVVPGWVLGEEPAAITLVSFTAQVDRGSVTLAWETGTEVDNAGFNLYRATAADGHYTKVNEALIAAKGDPVSGASYSLLDKELAPGTYYYKLEDVDLNGAVTKHGPVSGTVVPRFRRPAYRPAPPGS